MKIEKISIDKIKPYENNTKLHPPEQIEQIKKSILEFGNSDPIAIDENNVIIEGHGRYEALKQLGFDEVESIRLTHLNKQQKKAYALIHNKLTMNTDFDRDILEFELNEITSFDMIEFGFNKTQPICDLELNPKESFIENLLNEEIGHKKLNPEYFEITFTFPIKYQDKVKKYITKNGKEKLLDILLKEIEVI